MALAKSIQSSSSQILTPVPSAKHESLSNGQIEADIETSRVEFIVYPG